MLHAVVIGRDPASAATVRTALAEVGCTDIAAMRSVDELVHVAARSAQTWDLVVVDVVTRDDAAALARLGSPFSRSAIVAVTTEELFVAARDAGACEAVIKPLRASELIVRLHAALRLREHGPSPRERKLSEQVEMLERAKQQLERLACVDSLTGVANRRHTFQRLESELRRALREKTPLSVVMIDLDDFHGYNERYGHRGGDACLQRVTEALVHALRRPSDLLGRYGGEELVAVLPSTDAAGAKVVAERLRTTVEALQIPHEQSECARHVTLSAGFATVVGEAGDTVEALVRTADRALLYAKLDGRNRVAGDAPPLALAQLPASRWTRFAPVVADPWLVERIPAFLADTKGLGGALVSASEVRRDAALAFVHTVESGAAELGFSQLRRLASWVDHVISEGGDGATIVEGLREIIDYVEHVQVVYRRPVESRIDAPTSSA